MHDFLEHYHQELRHLRQGGQQFSQAYPQVAKHLGLNKGEEIDPFVERLLEGVAYLNARVHTRLDIQSSEFAEQMLLKLSPSFMKAVPSVLCVYFEPDFSSPETFRLHSLNRGSEVLAKIEGRKTPLKFSTLQDIHFLPIKIDNVLCTKSVDVVNGSLASYSVSGNGFLSFDFSIHGSDFFRNLLSAKQRPTIDLSMLCDAAKANALFTLMTALTTEIYLVNNDSIDGEFVRISPSERLHFKFDPEDVWPLDDLSSLQGIGLFKRYLSLPEQFLSIELDIFDLFKKFNHKCENFSLIFKLSQSPTEWLGQVSSEDFSLFATPIINLYRKRLDPVPYNPNKTEQWIPVDRQRPKDFYLWHIDNVSVAFKDGKVAPAVAVTEKGQYDNQDNFLQYHHQARKLKHGVAPQGKDAADVLEAYDTICLSGLESAQQFEEVNTIHAAGWVCDRYWDATTVANAKWSLAVSIGVEFGGCYRMPSKHKTNPPESTYWNATAFLAHDLLEMESNKLQDITKKAIEFLQLALSSQGSIESKKIDSIQKITIVPFYMPVHNRGPVGWVRSCYLKIYITSANHPDQGAWLFGRVISEMFMKFVPLNDGFLAEIHIDDVLMGQVSSLQSINLRSYQQSIRKGL